MTAIHETKLSVIHQALIKGGFSYLCRSTEGFLYQKEGGKVFEMWSGDTSKSSPVDIGYTVHQFIDFRELTGNGQRGADALPECLAHLEASTIAVFTAKRSKSGLVWALDCPNLPSTMMKQYLERYQIHVTLAKWDITGGEVYIGANGSLYMAIDNTGNRHIVYNNSPVNDTYAPPSGINTAIYKAICEQLSVTAPTVD